MNIVTCYICKQRKPRKLAHEHHKVPRAAGGPDTKENLCYLCPTCHDNLHRFAEMITAGKTNEAVDLANLEYPAPAPRKRSLELSQLVARSFASPIGVAPDEEVLVSVSLPRELVNRLRVLASEHPKENGRKLGVPKFAGMILTQYLIKKGMWRTDDTQFPIFKLAQRGSSLLTQTGILS